MRQQQTAQIPYYRKAEDSAYELVVVINNEARSVRVITPGFGFLRMLEMMDTKQLTTLSNLSGFIKDLNKELAEGQPKLNTCIDDVKDYNSKPWTHRCPNCDIIFRSHEIEKPGKCCSTKCTLIMNNEFINQFKPKFDKIEPLELEWDIDCEDVIILENRNKINEIIKSLNL